MRSFVVALVVLCSASVASAVNIGTPGSGFPVEVTFTSPVVAGVSARAPGETDWTPVDVSGNVATFTVLGNSGLQFQLWNQDRPYYIQTANLWFMAGDNTDFTTHFLEQSSTFPGTAHFQLTVTGPKPDNRVVNTMFQNFALVPINSVPEPTAALLACVAAPFFRRFSK